MAPARQAGRPQLLTYPDSLGGSLRAIRNLLRGPLHGLFSGVHILPPFPSSGDRGFAPLTYREIDPTFGTWADVSQLAEDHDVVLDLMINHVSRQSAEFSDFERHGRRSPYADLFLTVDKIWPSGDPPAEDVSRIFLRKPHDPFTTITITDTGEKETVWTTFGTEEWSEQIDIDVNSSAGRGLISESLRFFASRGVRVVRLDAVGYVIKKAGTSCFMVEPEIYEFLDWVVGVASSHGLIVLPEVHDHYTTHEKLAARGYWSYDFVLPALVLHSLETRSARKLGAHLSRSTQRQFTTLDCHDGVPIQPDLQGILEPAEMLHLVELVERHGGNVNRMLSDSHSNRVDAHQLNCTYYATLGCDDDRYVAARAIQLFAPGVPQIYYVGLLAGENDYDAISRAADGRAINRHDFTDE
ncbi:MAG TPA: sucrose phosphorylase, partial [Candidatus Dormibacteraeota bacterium]|nr:sucrose phosphorylase [Candidatus Dormibacteraeota bacterium]